MPQTPGQLILSSTIHLRQPLISFTSLSTARYILIMLPAQLPPEIWLLIVGTIRKSSRTAKEMSRDRQGCERPPGNIAIVLKNLCLSSRLLLRIVQPVLFEWIRVRPNQIGERAARYVARLEAFLQARPEVKAWVKGVDVGRWVRSWDRDIQENCGRIIRQLGNISTLIISGSHIAKDHPFVHSLLRDKHLCLEELLIADGLRNPINQFHLERLPQPLRLRRLEIINFPRHLLSSIISWDTLMEFELREIGDMVAIYDLAQHENVSSFKQLDRLTIGHCFDDLEEAKADILGFISLCPTIRYLQALGGPSPDADSMRISQEPAEILLPQLVEFVGDLGVGRNFVYGHPTLLSVDIITHKLVLTEDILGWLFSTNNLLQDVTLRRLKSIDGDLLSAIAGVIPQVRRLSLWLAMGDDPGTRRKFDGVSRSYGIVHDDAF